METSLAFTDTNLKNSDEGALVEHRFTHSDGRGTEITTVRVEIPRSIINEVGEVEVTVTSDTHKQKRQKTARTRPHPVEAQTEDRTHKGCGLMSGA